MPCSKWCVEGMCRVGNRHLANLFRHRKYANLQWFKTSAQSHNASTWAQYSAGHQCTAITWCTNTNNCFSGGCFRRGVVALVVY